MSLSLIPIAMAAQGTIDPSQAGGTLSTIIFLLGFILIFYFMLWRPQSKKAKEHQQLTSNLKKDDEVITNGGLLGRVIKVTEQFLVLEIATGVDVVVKNRLSQI